MFRKHCLVGLKTVKTTLNWVFVLRQMILQITQSCEKRAAMESTAWGNHFSILDMFQIYPTLPAFTTLQLNATFFRNKCFSYKFNGESFSFSVNHD